MGILNTFKDHFNKAEFTIAPNKKLKTISNDFKKAFGLSLVFYKGNLIAEDNLTLAGLNKKTSSAIQVKSDAEIKIRASMKVKDVEKAFQTTYGVKVQIKDKEAKKLVDDNISLGDASRGD
ncbi:hypothetical protein [Flagellimonas marinaquae]|uniref:hypothetical protein n=1 Tax=Flagellimonas marinaquae TaxID=254955 RepID=UPI000F8CE0F3|nr:hypothetical protein [Allomuricauda aquimarina]